jgi:hypothetical protein
MKTSLRYASLQPHHLLEGIRNHGRGETHALEIQAFYHPQLRLQWYADKQHNDSVMLNECDLIWPYS